MKHSNFQESNITLKRLRRRENLDTWRCIRKKNRKKVRFRIKNMVTVNCDFIAIPQLKNLLIKYQMALQPCKILSLVSPNQFTIQTQTSKVVIIGNGIPNFLNRNNLTLNTKALDCYFEQLKFVDHDALYIAKTNQIQINGADLIKAIEDDTQVHLKLIGVENSQPKLTQPVFDFIRNMRNKSLEAIFVSFEGNILNFLYNKDTIISLIPNAIYIDEFGIQDGQYQSLLQRQWLGREFKLNFRGTQILTVNHNGSYIHFPILKADIWVNNQANIDLSNEFYSSLVQQGFAYITDWGKLNLSQNSFQILYQCQEEAKKNNLGMWKNGELDRRMLNSVSSQLLGKVVEIIEANQYLIKTDKEVLNIKLDRIFIEGLEAKEFARKLLIGKKVHILQVGDNLPLYTIQLCENNMDVEEELISNGWATAKDNHPNLSKFKLQQFQQLNQAAKQKKLGQYSPELTWRIEDQTDQKQGKSVNEIIWSSIQRDKQSAKTQSVSTGVAVHHDHQLEVLIDKILPDGLLQVTILKYHSLVNFAIVGIVNLQEFATSFPTVTKYQEQRFTYTYDILMQRNAWINFDSFNMQENRFYGKLYLKKNNKDSDFTISLLCEGLAFLKKNNDYYSKYEEAQNTAQKQNKGFWIESYAQFILDFSQNKQTLKKQVSGTDNIQKNENQKYEQVIVTAVNDCNEFYIRKENNPQFEILETEVEKSQLIPLKKPVKKGTLCLARFSDDNRIYRAQVMQAFKNDKFLVKFIDYGNTDEVNFTEMGVLPAEFTSIPQQAKLCALAYLKVPPQSHEYAEEAADILRELIQDQTFDAKVVYTEKTTNRQFVTLKHQGQVDELQYTINKIALEKGLGRIENRVLYNPLKELSNFETEAKQNGLGIWGFDDCLEDEKQFQDEYDFYD